jgi:hypothetical protein
VSLDTRRGRTVLGNHLHPKPTLIEVATELNMGPGDPSSGSPGGNERVEDVIGLGRFRSLERLRVDVGERTSKCMQAFGATLRRCLVV